MRPTTLDLVPQTIDWAERRSTSGRARSPVPTLDALRTLDAFALEGPRSDVLIAAPGQASGSTLRRRLVAWSAQTVLARVHRVLLCMVRSGPDPRPRIWEWWWTAPQSGPSAEAS
ncbi:hypothetical protein [Arenibaculum pallidiluteum]|uniref:hypothetical protein n=1 Tax=Arenibaculum pallidiluteum TaxID=2812559 RepID=UPI001A965900|nr:hypothetical protein [Arenibaculum pallidiluteum]